MRRVAPDILLFANLGAVQLNYGYGIDQCRRAVDMIEADALTLHLNPFQEAVQDAGDTNFAGLAKKIEEVCKKMEVPVIAKEVGWGISERTAKLLADCGVSAIDVAGAGGQAGRKWKCTARPMNSHANSPPHLSAGESLHHESILNVKKAAPEYDRSSPAVASKTGSTSPSALPWRNARRHGKSIPQSRGSFNRESC